MLRACHRVLKPGGRIAYFNIFVSHDIPEEERRRHGRASPGQYTRAEQQGLLRSAGFTRIRESDVTPEYRRVQQDVIDANERHAKALRRALGAKEFAETQGRRRWTLERIEGGVLRRSLFVAEKRARVR